MRGHGRLGQFADLCSYLGIFAANGRGGAPPAGAQDPTSQDPRSNMNEGAGRLNDRVGWADIAAAGPADTAALPEFARFGSAFTMGGEFPIKGVLAGSLGIRGIRKDFTILSAFSHIFVKTTHICPRRRYKVKPAGSTPHPGPLPGRGGEGKPVAPSGFAHVLRPFSSAGYSQPNGEVGGQRVNGEFGRGVARRAAKGAKVDQAKSDQIKPFR